MIQKIDLKTFKLISNYVLIKPDPNYDVVFIDGPDGKKIDLKITATGENEAQQYSISGTVIKKPAKTYFFDKSTDCSQAEFASCMKASLQVDGDFDFDEGAKIYYNYNVQINCEEENRLVDTDEHGILMLISLDSLYGYIDGENIVPVNGYVFYKRDEEEREVQFKHGLIGIREANPYAQLPCTIIAASKPVRAYLDPSPAGPDVFNPGDRIMVDKRFGYRMAYDLYAGDLMKVEVCLRKHVLCVLEEA